MTNNPTIDGVSRDYKHCPFCNALTEYTHRDGLPVCKCPVKSCKGHERWLEYDEFAELAAHVAERQPVEFPAGAIHNGRAFIDQLESIYAFKEQQGHPLSLCSEWQELVRCFEWLANHATEAQSTIAQQAALIASLRSELSESYSIDTAPPALVAAVLPERMEPPSDYAYRKGWNACLDATAALNGERK